jgi:hypothetical protein
VARHTCVGYENPDDCEACCPTVSQGSPKDPVKPSAPAHVREEPVVIDLDLKTCMFEGCRGGGSREAVRKLRVAAIPGLEVVLSLCEECHADALRVLGHESR